MRKMKNKKLKASLSLTGYLLLALALCFVGAFVFHSYYYELIYVSGASMAPTLNGGDKDEGEHGAKVDFGIVDPHQSAINHIKRFDIISTYYPNSAGYNKDYTADGKLKRSATKKIKRVIALPNETFIIKDGLLSVKVNDEFVEVKNQPKLTVTTVKDTVEPITLGENEYWVLGDNRTNSTDCGTATIRTPIQKKNIAGVLVAIEGKAELKLKRYVCSNCGKAYKSGSTCTECGGQLAPEYGLSNKQYHWPKFY